ncbi:SDR family NAD(P)-dependent oxidoreductase [Actinoplanes sp. NPDC026619]|uniref:SDR family NAD(P)-dependent oxidoreductase n=1 Tax=Actinoplanes sp. NPDC026619 TaxID=3155798 RepID=UPI003403F90B
MSVRTVVISGGTDGMGLALARARAAQGDTVVALGSSAEKGRRLAGIGHFLQVDLSDVEDTRRVVSRLKESWPQIDALALFANRQGPRREENRQGLERTFALYYLSRYLLGQAYRDSAGLIVNVAGVGVTKGTIAWDDLQLTSGYGMIRAQLQAGRLNDLLGVAQSGGKARYVLYHPGFTRSGDMSTLPAPLRAAIKIAAKVKARSVEESIRPVETWIDNPPPAPLTAVDRDRELPLTLPTLDGGDAHRLASSTQQLLRDAARD